MFNGFLSLLAPPAAINRHYEAAAMPVKLPRPLSARAEAFGLSLDRRKGSWLGGFLYVPMASVSGASNHKEKGIRYESDIQEP